MQLVVVMAVRNAVSAATNTFTATSIILFFIMLLFLVQKLSSQRHTQIFRSENAQWSLRSKL